MSEGYSSSGYRIELLKGDNWVPWKRRMLAVLRDLNLEKYIEPTAMSPTPEDPTKPTKDETEAMDKWREGDARARTRIELAIGDAEMIHVSGASTAREMWDQLTMVKESKGQLGMLATRRALYRATAEEGFEMVGHISRLRQLQEELHIFGNLVSDEDFVMILLTSLPESWDNYTTSLFGSSGNKPTIKSHELVAVLLEEDRRRKARSGESSGTALHAHAKARGKFGDDNPNKDKECFNCRKKGHVKGDCWAKGGGKEGQGPKGRKGSKKGNKANQAAEEVNTNLNDCAYMASPFNHSREITKYDWLLDSGTTSHICTIRDAFTEFRTVDETLNGVGEGTPVKGRGTVNLKFEFEGKSFTHQLRNTLYTPDAPNCLLSLSRFDDSGGRVDFNDGMCWLKNKEGKIIGKGYKHQRLYLLTARAILQEKERSNYAATKKLPWDEWHRRFGHISISALQQLDKQGLVSGLIIDQSSIPSHTCEACIQAKQKHKPFPQEAENRSEIAGERFLSDVWGPAKVTSIGGWRYYISFIDDAKRYDSILFLVKKSDSTERIKGHVVKLKQKFGRAPKFMRVDNGAELVNGEVKKFAEQEGITIEMTAPYSPSQNGIAERFNRTILELVRAMLIAKGLPPFLWDEAARHATYLRNRAPTRALSGMTPYEAWHGKKPDISHLREFGCDVWVLDESLNKSKLAPKSNKMVFVGFEDGSKAVRYWDKATRRVKVSRNVVFNENDEALVGDVPGISAEGEDEEDPASTPAPKDAQASNADTQTSNAQAHAKDESDTRNLRTKARIDYKQLNNPSIRQPPTQRTSGFTIRIPPTIPPDIARPTEASKAKTLERNKANLAIDALRRNIQEEGEYAFRASEEDLPKDYEDAIRGDEGEKWKAAMDEEIEMLGKMGTWRLEDLPTDRKPVGCRWVYAKKRNEYGEVIKYKARLVAQGFSQKPGTDFSNDGTFAPVMRFETLRTLLAFSAIHNLKLRQLDVKGAYLHGRLNEIIYMAQPPGYHDGSGRSCLLIRSLYGLKQAGNVWNQELNRVLAEIKFTQLKTDYCCYIRREDDEFTILLVWVDDFVSISTTDDRNNAAEKDLKVHFDVKSLGQPNLLLGMKIHQENHLITLSQTHYIDALLEKFGLTDMNPVSTPMDINVKLDAITKDQEEQGEAHDRITQGYAALIGSLMYLAIGTRPDIAFTVNKLAQFTQNPRQIHWTAVKRVFRYLKYTRSSKLTYGGDDDVLNTNLHIFCDADWASDATDRKSISGYLISMAGGAVSWSSKKQTSVALSTAEAEYMAATHVAKQVLWQRSLFTELNFEFPTTSTIFTDNQAAISISHHPEFHSRTKHIDIAYHFLRDLIADGTLNTIYVNTLENLADLFTKGFPRQRHEDLTYRIGVLSGQGGVL
jgi:transposase InsO family protein